MARSVRSSKSIAPIVSPAARYAIASLVSSIKIAQMTSERATAQRTADGTRATAQRTPGGTPRRAVVGRAAAIGLATGAYGLSFGALAIAAGLSLAQAVAMSAFVFTGATQLSVVGALAAGGAAAPAVASGLLLASRHVAYGIAVAPLLPGALRARLVAAHLVIDESTAMARAQADPPGARIAFWATGASVFVCWNAATVAGALIGRAIADPAELGLDAVFPAAFVALLAPQLRGRDPRRVAIAGAVVAAALVPIAPAGIPVLAAAAAVLVAGR
jgi:predicted branched-subunit amino acid permease